MLRVKDVPANDEEVDAIDVIVTLCISWHIARIRGVSESAAILKSARKLRDQTKSKVVYNCLNTVINATQPKYIKGVLMTRDQLVVRFVQELQDDLFEIT